MASDKLEDQATPPVLPVDIAPHSGFRDVRTNPSEGACGIHDYPCTHPGVDLVASAGTVVHAPHAGWVWVSQPWSMEAPFAGYGPSVVLLAHDDGDASGALDRRNQRVTTWSLLAHLDPDSLRFKRLWTDEMVPDPTLKTGGGGAFAPMPVWIPGESPHSWTYNTNAPPPLQKLDDRIPIPGMPAPSSPISLVDPAYYVNVGDAVGRIGSAHHVHWEIRKAPLASLAEMNLENPFTWLRNYSARDWLQAKKPGNWQDNKPISPLDAGARGAAQGASSSSGGGLGTLFVVAAGAYVLGGGGSSRRGRR